MSFMFFAERYFPWPTLTNIGNWNFFSRFVTGSRHPLLTDFILSTKGGGLLNDLVFGTSLDVTMSKKILSPKNIFV